MCDLRSPLKIDFLWSGREQQRQRVKRQTIHLILIILQIQIMIIKLLLPPDHTRVLIILNATQEFTKVLELPLL